MGGGKLHIIQNHNYFDKISSFIVCYANNSKSFIIPFLLTDLQVRKMAYVQGNSVPVANLEVLDKLIAARHEFAQVNFSYFYINISTNLYNIFLLICICSLIEMMICV